MAKPQEKIGSSALRQIRPPPLSQHLREFASRPGAWLVVARNIIPVVGIYAFGWSAAVSVKDHVTLVGNVVRGVFVWLLLVGVVGLPYWIVLIPLHDLLLGNELRRQLAQSPALWFTFGSLAASHFWKAFRMGYDTMSDKELKQRARWDIYLLILRAIAMFIMAAHGLAFILVPLMALLLSYLEIWPERALGAVFGNPSRLWEYDPDSSTSSRRR
ncbi:MAG: hypothetical protein DMF12_04070 [Verrucomicrobia bacterium]|nr:MAG: hypothetical protein DMF12_04070 [Verrucomicrobiota bacterium]